MPTKTKQSEAQKIPKLRFSGFSSEWAEKMLGEVCKKIQDGNYGGSYPKADEFVNSGIPFLTSKAIGNNGILDKNKIDYLPIKKHNKLKKAHLKLNDVLFTNRGSNVGSIGFVDNRIANGNIGPQLTLLRSDINIISPLFLRFLMTSFRVRKQIFSQDSGSAMNFFGIKDTSKFKFFLPALLEQQKIADFLGSVDEWIENLRAQKEKLEKYKKGMMQKLLCGSFRFPEFRQTELKIRDGYIISKLGSFPVDWDLRRLQEVLWFQEGPGVRTSQFRKKGVKLFNGTNIQKNKIVLENTTTFISTDEANSTYKHFLVDNGDLVIACSGISVDKFDEKVAFINERHLPLCMNTSTMRFKSLNENVLNLNYFRYFICTPIFKNQIRRQITGSAQLNFGPSHTAIFYIPLPSIEEQQKISKFLTSLDSLIESKQKHITHAEKWRKGLMQQLFV